MCGKLERDIVHGRRSHGIPYPALLAGPAMGAEGAQAKRDEHVLIGLRRHLCPPMRSMQAGQVAVEVEGGYSVVLVRHLRHHGGIVGWITFFAMVVVPHDPSGDEDRDLRVRQWRLVWQSDHVVSTMGLISYHERVHRLAWRDGDDIRGVGIDVVGVGGNYSELVPGDLEVVLGEKNSVDYS